MEKLKKILSIIFIIIGSILILYGIWMLSTIFSGDYTYIWWGIFPILISGILLLLGFRWVESYENWFGVVGFVLSLTGMLLTLYCMFRVFSLRGVIMIFTFVISITSLIFCIFQQKRKRTKLAKAGIILSIILIAFSLMILLFSKFIEIFSEGSGGTGYP